MVRPQEKRVLVVDDEEDVVYFLSTALEDAGFQVDTAYNVDEALGRVKASPPDCVSLDMVMPGKSGIVLFHELRKNPAWSRIPVIFVTAHSKDKGVRQDLEAALADSTLSGPATYLDKPVTAAKFVKAIAAALKVELSEPGQREEPAPGVLKREVLNLLDRADPDVLRKALDVLKGKSGG